MTPAKVGNSAAVVLLATVTEAAMRQHDKVNGPTTKGLNIAFVRMFELSPVWILQNEKRFAGCRSWIDLPSPPEMKMRPVVDDEAHQRLRAQFDRLTGNLPAFR